MALIKCPECGKKISDKAIACIHCGCPVSSMLEQQEKTKLVPNIEELKQNEFVENIEENNGCAEDSNTDTEKKLKLWHKILIIIAAVILLALATVALFGGLSQKGETNEHTQDTSSNVSADTNIDDADIEVSKESFISNDLFTFSARSFIKLFDESDKEAKGYNYTYMRMNGETSLFYELAEISGGYEKVRSVGMVSFVKGVDTTMTIEEDYTENIITKINVLVEDVDDVPPILVGCMCAVDPALDFKTAFNLGMDVVEKAGTKDGYVHNGVKYVVAIDGEYYYIIISVANASTDKDGVTSNPSSSKPGTVQPTGFNHNWKVVSCSSPRKCSNCGAEEEKAIGHNWIKEESKPVVCGHCSQKYPCNVSFEYAPDIIGELGITPEVRIDSINISQEAHYNSYDDVIYAYLVVTITGHNSSSYYESATIDIGEVWDGGGKVEFFIPTGNFNMSEWTLVDDLNGTYYVDIVG